jgi:NitT/TauT family transport system ATP-binding protein
MSTATHIELQRVWKSYGDTVVLENLSLSIEGAEFCTVVGASGCGKTTFLRMLLGEEQPSRGRLRLNGGAFPGEPGAERGIVFQRYSVFPHLTVRRNVLLGLELKGSPLLARLWGKARREALERVDESLDAVGLYPARGKYPAALSGGMQQRLAIAQSLVTEPEILLLDEPFGALDPGIRADMHGLITKLWEQTRMTIVMITHDLAEGFGLGTRLLVFDKVRHDPQAPEAFGATVTYDIPLRKKTPAAYQELRDQQQSNLLPALERAG